MPPVLRILTHNGRLKLLALVLSVFLWALVQTEPRNQETFSAVPVVVTLSDTAWALASDPEPATVDLRLGGPAREIIRLAREGTTVRVPVDSVSSADTMVTLRRDWVDLSGRSGILVESVSPSAVRLQFERAVTRLVPLAVRVQGELPPELALASPVGLNPQRARVRGAESRVAGLDSVLLRPFDLSRVASSGVFTVEVDTTGLHGARVVPRTATLGLRVEEKDERVLGDLAIQARASDPSVSLEVDPATVRLTVVGARTLVGRVDPTLIAVWIPPESLAGMAPGDERRVSLRIDGVPELVRAIPDRTVVTVRRLDGAGAAGRGPGGSP